MAMVRSTTPASDIDRTQFQQLILDGIKEPD